MVEIHSVDWDSSPLQYFPKYPDVLNILLGMTDQITLASQELDFERTILHLNLILFGNNDSKYIFKVIEDRDVRVCIDLLKKLINIIENLLSVSVSRLEFEKSLPDERKFRMSILILNIFRSMIELLGFQENVPSIINYSYERYIKPLLIKLKGKLLVLNFWLYDLIFSEFSARKDFGAIAYCCNFSHGDEYLPNYGPFNNEMKDSFERIKSTLGNGNYKCIQCQISLNVSNSAIWSECDHVCWCARCAFYNLVMTHKIKPAFVDGSYHFSVQQDMKECPQCLVPFTLWSKGRYMMDASKHNYPDPKKRPDSATRKRDIFESIRRIRFLSMLQGGTDSYNLQLLLNETVSLLPRYY